MEPPRTATTSHPDTAASSQYATTPKPQRRLPSPGYLTYVAQEVLELDKLLGDVAAGKVIKAQQDFTALKEMVGKQISVITCDGRNIVGQLRGYDQVTNVILNECHERVYSLDAGVEQVVLGLYVIRGDNIAIVGELDPELDARIRKFARVGTKRS